MYFKKKNIILLFNYTKTHYCISIINTSFLIFYWNQIILVNYIKKHTNIKKINEKKNYFLKSCNIYNFKLEFNGKGFKINKQLNTLTLSFNRAHFVYLVFIKILIKKLKKNKLIIISQTNKNIKNFIKKALLSRIYNTYTKRGIRLSRMLIKKRRGKIVSN